MTRMEPKAPVEAFNSDQNMMGVQCLFDLSPLYGGPAGPRHCH